MWVPNYDKLLLCDNLPQHSRSDHREREIFHEWIKHVEIDLEQNKQKINIKHKMIIILNNNRI